MDPISQYLLSLGWLPATDPQAGAFTRPDGQFRVFVGTDGKWVLEGLLLEPGAGLLTIGSTVEQLEADLIMAAIQAEEVA